MWDRDHSPVFGVYEGRNLSVSVSVSACGVADNLT